MDYICKGVPAFKGHMRRIPHAGDEFCSTYATAAGNRGEEDDGVNQHDSMTQLMTMRTMGPGTASRPWATMEQPSYSFYFGTLPGTVTLNQWATTASARPPTIALRDSGVVARDVDLVRIFGRLKDLELGLEDNDVDYMYKNLYRKFLKDPDRVLSPHKTLDKQITDLILVLTRPDHWIDFSQAKNQIVTRFIFDTAHVNHEQYVKFFHQLLLSMELDLRIHSRQHGEWAKEKLLEQLPPAIKWNLALSRRWRDNVRIEAYGSTADQVKLRYKLKRRQVKMIKRFAQMMKWPNLAETLASLRQGYDASNLDAISSHAMAFFSGLVLPGPSFPFVMMNALIDIDPDEATDDLALLIHLNPNCGFQYRNSYTYWTSTSIVGKVLAPTCHEVAGWVGPARPTPDLSRSQIARVRSRPPRQRLTPEDVRLMSERSDPLGPPTDAFPVEDYDMIRPDTDNIVDTVRIELLSMKPCAERMADPGPKWFNAAIQFAIDGVSWPLRLTYDVHFISAWPCTQGPHPLFYDYTYLAVAADEVISIRDWAGLYGARSRGRRPSMNGNGNGHATTKGKSGDHSKDEEEDVLVIEAFGVPDNEVLARAWCAHWGLSAVVADIGKTCMACAIREAYAAVLTVVILVDNSSNQASYDD
ncbi:hypothetical protein M406DRAFT_276533 [Cryphonectria parasitica EP155]|uniref:Uncharacterized protein n=1 Tax=Cryphonectria parasitica (strain ATCC 38755 / EP155) TaxID=660469 RepID=A0A9P4Y372_CRYP1|nr:uncharacterized protein M406DRAFT_276533 [Cryphonectria parasitica EP155]KAF3765838.1 hypothetical protein M406DRAFT_276533 [Cryphonectria parasitica EP155]